MPDQNSGRRYPARDIVALGDRQRAQDRKAAGSTGGTGADDRLIEWIPFHYGWVILVSGARGAFMTTPGQTIGVFSFFDLLAKDLGLSRAEVALAIGTLASILPAPLVGRWTDRRGPRVTAGAIAFSLALA